MDINFHIFDASDNPDVLNDLLVKNFLEKIRKNNPDLFKFLRLISLPRFINIDIVNFIINELDDYSERKKIILWEQVGSSPLIQEVGVNPSLFLLNKVLRDALLVTWHTNEDMLLYKELNHKLYQLFDQYNDTNEALYHLFAFSLNKAFPIFLYQIKVALQESRSSKAEELVRVMSVYKIQFRGDQILLAEQSEWIVLVATAIHPKKVEDRIIDRIFHLDFPDVIIEMLLDSIVRFLVSGYQQAALLAQKYMIAAIQRSTDFASVKHIYLSKVQKQLDTATIDYNLGLELAKYYNHTPGLTIFFLKLGEQARAESNNARAVSYFIESLKYSRLTNDIDTAFVLNMYLGELEQEKNNLEQAQNYFQNALYLSKKILDLNGGGTVQAVISYLSVEDKSKNDSMINNITNKFYKGYKTLQFGAMTLSFTVILISVIFRISLLNYTSLPQLNDNPIETAFFLLSILRSLLWVYLYQFVTY